MRLKVKLGGRPNSDDVLVKSNFLGRRITVRSSERGKPLNTSHWIEFRAYRFKTSEAAATFGIKLQSALAAISASKKVGIDVGADMKSNKSIKKASRNSSKYLNNFIGDDEIGVSVFPDTQTMLISGGDITEEIGTPIFQLLESLQKITPNNSLIGDRERESAILINAAFMAEHPAAILVLSIAAVELLAKDDEWSERQKIYLAELSDKILSSDILLENEKDELKEKFKNLGKLSIRSKVRRLLLNLKLMSLFVEWDKIYDKRSRLFHGDRFMSYEELTSLGYESRILCQEIVGTHLRNQIQGLN